jgi:hypothetical protein
MSVLDLRAAFEIIEKNKERADFVGPRSEALVEIVEQRLNVRFPPTYREFVLKYGAGNVGAVEICGVISDEIDNDSIPNGAWLTSDLRAKSALPSNCVAIGETGDGGYYCIILGDTAESPVGIFMPGSPSTKGRIEIIAEDFGRFLRMQLARYA